MKSTAPRIPVRQMVIDSMLAAMCAALAVISIPLGNMKLTLESVPIVLGALLFGPVDGALIGFVGSFVYQVLSYGISATTLLWILPYFVCGLVIGAYAKRRDFNLTAVQTVIIVVIGEFLVTALNTGVMYVDSKIYGYYSYAYIFGSVVLRFVICVGKSIVIGCIMPPLLKLIRERVLKR